MKNLEKNKIGQKFWSEQIWIQMRKFSGSKTFFADFFASTCSEVTEIKLTKSGSRFVLLEKVGF